MLSRSILFFAVVGATAAHTQPWLYSEIDGRGPSGWGSLYPECKATKQRQSPVNIARPQVDNELLPLMTYYTPANGLEVTNNQHSVDVVPLNNDGNYLIDPNNWNRRYNLKGIHFHSPSEHGIGGGLFDLEVHLVHQLADADPMAVEQYTVIAFLFRQGSTPNANFDFFVELPTVPMPNFDHISNASHEYEYNTMTAESAKFDFGALMASRKYYTYSGSFTTPPCTEAVRWYVMQDVLPISTAQVNAFRTAMKFDEELNLDNNDFGWQPSLFQYFGNNRPVQALNDRTIRSFSDSFQKTDDSEKSVGWRMGVSAVVLGSFAVFLALGAILISAAKASAVEADTVEVGKLDP